MSSVNVVHRVRRAAFLFAALLALVAPLSAHAVSDAPIDQSKPVSTWCTPELFACDEYTARSDEQYLPPWTPAYKNVQGYYHNDLNGIYGMPSYAIAITRNDQGDATSVVGCTDIASPSCSGTEVRFRANLPMCSGQISIDCMRDIVVIDKQGKSLPFSMVGEFPTGNPQYFVGSKTLKVPNGGGLTLIKVPEAPHNGGDLYLVKTEMRGVQTKAGQPFYVTNFAVSFTAVKLIDGKYTYSGASTDAKLYPKGFAEVGTETGTYPFTCAAASPTQCAARYSLPMGLRLGVTIDLSQKMKGWLHGRVKAPEVKVSTNSTGGSTLQISAEPINIPVNAAWVLNDNAPQSIKDFYVGKLNSGAPLFGPENKSKPLSEIALLRTGNTAHTSETLNEYLAWLATLGDKAQALPTAWIMQMMSSDQVSDQIQKCLNASDSLAGIVTTNAAEYLDGPPVFDKTTQSLDYKVAATHFEPDGVTPFKGTYDLVMSSSVARCIYGFTNAPVSATVSVTSEKGGDNAAATVVSEKDGWLSLSAYNFTYSSPTIRVVLTGTPEKSIPTQVIAAPKKVIKISCIKGKRIIQVTGSKCPSGYKKK